MASRKDSLSDPDTVAKRQAYWEGQHQAFAVAAHACNVSAGQAFVDRKDDVAQALREEARLLKVKAADALAAAEACEDTSAGL